MPIQPKQQPPYYQEGTGIKEYTALISQTSTNAPTVTIIKNTIGNIVWTRFAEGIYYGTLSNTFTIGKTTFFGGQAGTIIQLDNPDEHYVKIVTMDNLYAAQDSWLANLPITIKIYPNV